VLGGRLERRPPRSEAKPSEVPGSVWPIVLALLLTAFAARAQTAEAPPAERRVAPFSLAPEGGAPAGWRPVEFPKIRSHTRYAIVSDGGARVLRAESDASASGLIAPLDLDLREWPRLAWRWKVAGTLARGDVTRREGDDYPARVYVAFAYDPDDLSLGERVAYLGARLLWGELPARALNYVWAAREPRESFHTNAYTSSARLVVLRNASDPLDTWLDEERDVLADYRRAFGREPPRVAGVAVMTDTDDTGESARAWYGDLVFLGGER
jgi:hypothetical protein